MGAYDCRAPSVSRTTIRLFGGVFPVREGSYFSDRVSAIFYRNILLIRILEANITELETLFPRLKKTNVSIHHGGPIEGPLKPPPRISQLYRIQRFINIPN